MSQEIENSLFKKLEIISPFYRSKKTVLTQKINVLPHKKLFFAGSRTNFLCFEILFMEIFLFRQNLEKNFC
jgi:hypothetical protein